MTNRENLIRALRRQNPERIPFEFNVCPAIHEKLEKLLGTPNYDEQFGFVTRWIGLKPTRKQTDFTKYYKNLPDNTEPLNWAKEWGIMGVNSKNSHFQKMLHPMLDFTSIEEIEAYPFPDFNEDYRWEGFEEELKELKEKDLVSVAELQMTIFETSWYLRGMENFMVDLMTDPDFACALMDKITDIRVGMAQRYAKAGVDIIQLGDDVATQLDMMINPELWRELIKPRLAKVVKAIKDTNPEVIIFYHGDGNMQKIIPDIIELGIDVLNPIQPECMDPFEIKRLYGDKLSFWGTVGTQTTLPFGTPEEVKATCKKLIEEVGKGGGLLLAPTHLIEPEVPIENLMAFLEAVKEYGNYR